MQIVLAIAVVVAHLPIAYLFIRGFSRSRFPDPVMFAAVGILAYYDLGLVLEAFGLPFKSPYFPSLRGQSPTTVWISMVLLVLGPWALLLGARLGGRGARSVPVRIRRELSMKGHRLFLGACLLVCLPLASIGLAIYFSTEQSWKTRDAVSEHLGAAALLLPLPMAFLGFYLFLRNSRTLTGRVVSLTLALLTAAATLPLGERTLLLLPFLLIALFGFRPSLRTLLIGVAACVAAAMALVEFTGKGGADRAGAVQSILSTINYDLTRSPGLGAAVANSPALGTHVMPYLASGYVAVLFAFVPRWIFPFRGLSTAHQFTSYLTKYKSARWGLGFGPLEEAVLNVGWLSALPIMVLWGWLWSLAGRLVRPFPSLVPPLTFWAVWFAGYHAQAGLYLFGVLAAAQVLLEITFRRWISRDPIPLTGSHPAPRPGATGPAHT